MMTRDLGRFGHNRSWGTENRERTNNYFLNILNSACEEKKFYANSDFRLKKELELIFYYHFLFEDFHEFMIAQQP